MAGGLLAAACTRLPSNVTSLGGTGGPASWSAMLASSASPVVPGNAVEILVDGPDIFSSMLAAIRSARHTITYEPFAYKDGEISRTFAEALAERCQAGVAVHILIDGFSVRWVPSATRKLLEAAGCEFVVFRPLHFTDPRTLNARSHRRILVVDGRVGFAGGSVVALDWVEENGNGKRLRETDIKVEGPAAGWLQRAFARLWREATGRTLSGTAYYPALAATGPAAVQIVDSAPRDGHYGAYALYMQAIMAARRSIRITNQYLVLDDRMTAALRDAVSRGVRVDIIVPGASTNPLLYAAARVRLDRLLLGGVNVHAYGPRSLHAKTMVVDGAWATVGSANLDPRSFEINEELNVATPDDAVSARLEAIFRDDLASTTTITYDAWTRRRLWIRLLGYLTLPIRSQL